ncbi:MAG: hypothetical protein P8X82_16985 [Gemmatimonadales bacterium]
MDDLFQLLFFAALILFGLLGSARKKKKGQQVQPPRRPPVRRPPVERREPAREATRAQSSASAPPPRQRSIAQELFELLQERVDVEPPPPPVMEPVVAEDEAKSLETLEPAGGKSHERFHELYVSEEETTKPYERKTATPYKQEKGSESYGEHIDDRKTKLELSRRKLQQAFIMKEILGPPKGME